MGDLKPIVLEFYHVPSLGGGHLVYNLTNFPNLLIIFPNFFHNVLDTTHISHISIANLPQCVCTHPINPMGIHLLHCAHGNEHKATHDAICDTFVAIAWDANFHMGK